MYDFLTTEQPVISPTGLEPVLSQPSKLFASGMMESTGPMTRSRAKCGAAVGTSSAPSTRKRAATHSSLKATPAAAKDLLAVEPDDTATRADVTENTQEQQPSSSASDPSPADQEPDMPATVIAAPQGCTSTTGVAAIAGLTPVSAVVTPGIPAATPCTMGPSPVQPIQLESLWSHEMAPASTDSRPFSAGGMAACSSTSNVDADLAAMFISTPARTADAASPVEGLVSDAPVGVTSSLEQQAFAEQPFGGFAEAAAAAESEPAEASQEPALQQIDADNAEPDGFGSPAPTAAVEDGVVTELEDAAPSAPLLPISPKPASSPAPAASTATPAGSRWTLHSSTHSPAPNAAAVAAASPVPMPSPGLDDYDDDDLPPADEEYPEEALLRLEAKAAGLLPPSPVPAACAMPTDSVSAVETDNLCALAVGQEYSAAAPADVDMASEEYSEELLLPPTEDEEELLLPPTEDEEELLSDAEEAELSELQTELDAQATAMTSQQKVDEADEADVMECVDEDTAAAAPEGTTAVEVAAGAAAEPAFVTCPTPGAKSAVASAAAGLSVMSSPDVVALPMVTSPSRTAGTATTTTAPPKSAMAKPKTAGATSARKSACVVVPSPSGSHKIAAGSKFQHSSADEGSSPGHTPYPSKAKVKAAAAAANHGSVAAAPKAAGVSHKKEIALACADSALKKYAKVTAAEQQQGSSTGGSTKKSPSPNVGSRLLQPTASFMAKARSSSTPEADPYVWSPPEAETSSAAAPAPKPRLASKVVVPSPPSAHGAAEPSLKSLKRAIKEKTAAKAKATVAEHRSRSAADKVDDVQQIRGSKSKDAKVKAPPAEEQELEFDEDDYTDEVYDQDADALADSLAGMRVGQLHVGRPAGPLKGVAAPAGKHLVFDEEGKAKETPASKMRQPPRHTYFDDEGKPVEAPAARPIWR